MNPSVLSQAGMPFSGVLTATVLVCIFQQPDDGLVCEEPCTGSAGYGTECFFYFFGSDRYESSLAVALGAVFWSGVSFLILSVFNIRTYIVRAIPRPLRYAIAAGIGLFITLIGFVNAGFIVHNPATIVGIGK